MGKSLNSSWVLFLERAMLVSSSRFNLIFKAHTQKNNLHSVFKTFSACLGFSKQLCKYTHPCTCLGPSFCSLASPSLYFPMEPKATQISSKINPTSQALAARYLPGIPRDPQSLSPKDQRFTVKYLV